MKMIRRRKPVITLSAMLIALHPCMAAAAPGDILFSDMFDGPQLAPWTTSDASRSGILSGGPTSKSNPKAAYTNGGPVTVTSPSFDAVVPAAQVSIWVRRGDDQISDSPESGEDFVVEYQRADTSWGPLAAYLGSGTAGEIYEDTLVLPADALHGALAIRVRQTAGDTVQGDYWHFDDVVVTESAIAAPLGVGSCDDFETGLSNWTITSGTGLAGTSNATASSPNNSLFLNGGTVTVTSTVIDTSDVTFSDLTLWVRRGRNSFSDKTEAGEDLVVEYLTNLGVWTTLETFPGGGSAGQPLTPVYNLPADGRHPAFQLRLRMTAGSNIAEDFWHIDDVCFAQNLDPILQVTKVATLLSDPVNGSSNPKAIPGAILEYTINVSNIGIGSTDTNSVEITDPLPPNTALYVSTTGGDPIVFVDGTPASGLGFDYGVDVEYTDIPGGIGPYNHIPAPDGQGFDPLITGYRITPSGPINGSGIAGDPNFSIVFQIRIE